eukprot:5692190-Prorocentrum_lima.AAC.1
MSVATLVIGLPGVDEDLVFPDGSSELEVVSSDIDVSFHDGFADEEHDAFMAKDGSEQKGADAPG